MTFILQKLLHGRLRQILPIWFLLLSTACAYRFSNSSLLPPEGIRTIAIEAVYDTSRDVIPHELIWSAVQREIARTGRLVLTSHNEADALMTLWVTSSKVMPGGTPSQEPKAKDPIANGTDIPSPLEFRELRRAGSWTSDETVNFTLEVEVHDLKSRKILFKKSYTRGAGFKSLRAQTITPVASGFMHYEEALRAQVKFLSDQLAQTMVTDFFASRGSTQ